MDEASCSRETSPRFDGTSDTLASCTATRISFRSTPPASAASSPRWSHSHSRNFTGPGLASWCKETPRRPCVVRRIATCGHSKALHSSRIESPNKSLLHERQLSRREIPKIRKHFRQRIVRHAEPGREGRAVLIQRNRGHPDSASGHVFWPLQRKNRKRSVHIRRFHRTSHHQVMASPSVVRARAAAGLQGPAKFRFGEGHNLLLDLHLQRGVIES